MSILMLFFELCPSCPNDIPKYNMRLPCNFLWEMMADLKDKDVIKTLKNLICFITLPPLCTYVRARGYDMTTLYDHACLDSSTQAMAWKLLNQWVWNKGVIITMWGIYVESVLYSPTTLKLCLIDIFLCAHIRFKLLKRKLGLALNLSRMQC